MSVAEANVEVQLVDPRELTLDPQIQLRLTLNDDWIERLQEVLREGGKFATPIQVVDDGTHLWVWNGHHRTSAAILEGVADVEIEVRLGTRRDALKLALGANEVGVLARSRADVANAVICALSDPEWGKLPSREIAKLCGCSHTTVNTIKKERMGQPAEAAAESPGKVASNGQASSPPDARAAAEPPPSEPLATPEQLAAAAAVELNEFLATLPAYDKVTAQPQLVFEEEVRYWKRFMESAQWAGCKHLIEQIVNTTKVGHRGPWVALLERFAANHPRAWRHCGFCDGTGYRDEGSCRSCQGYGYRVEPKKG
jgi:hypothetical protein